MTARTTRASAKVAEADSIIKTEDDTPRKSRSRAAPPPESTSKASTSPTPEANTSRKRKKPSVKQEDDESLPRGKATPPKRARTTKAKKPSEADLAGGAKMASAWVDDGDGQIASPAKNSRSNPYNLTPGTSPYPDYAHPTPEECQHVNDVLSKIHGKITAPKTVPVPNLNSSGCGEVPSVLDALIRTRLSAATNGANSSRAFRGLVEHFGIIKDGVGKGSVNWDAVRNADVDEVLECIRSGGLAAVKSRDIKNILQLVYEENQARREKLEDAASDTMKSGDSSAVAKAQSNVLTLDHLHEMTSDDAFNKLIQYPGIGPKTASCVLLFCMQRPSFAVDTHVFRLTRWLGWTPSDSQVKGMAAKKGIAVADKQEVQGDGETTTKSPGKRARGPPPVTRNSTYSHLDVRIPDELKYPLHYLFIKHGKTCPSCSAKPDRATKEAWGAKVCPLRELKTGRTLKKVPKKLNGEQAEEEDVVSTGEEDEEGSDEVSEDGEE